MASVGAGYVSGTSRNFPIIIATNRSSAVLLPVRLRYNANGYAAGTVLARNTTDGLFEAYNDAGASGLTIAAAVLFEPHQVEDFGGTGNSSGTCLAVGIFGGCTVYEDKLVGLDANAKIDLLAKTIVDATGVKTMKF